MELSCTRGAHFEKITFFVSDSFFYEIWLENESQKAAKMAPKTVQKSMVFFNEKKVHFLPKMEPKREAKWDQGATKRGTKRHLKRDPEKNTKIEVKSRQN